MKNRERVLTALGHREPDRVPIDFGGTTDSTILAPAYRELRAHLGMAARRVRMADPTGLTACVDDDVRQALGVDTMPVFGEPLKWKPGTLRDGTPVELPERFSPVTRGDGSQVVLGDKGEVELLRPATGLYFEPVCSPLADATSVKDIEREMARIEAYDTPYWFDKSYEHLAEKAKALRDQTEYLIVGFFGGHIFQLGQSLRGWETFLVDLLVNQKFAEALMDAAAQAHIRRFKRYAETVAPHLDVIQFEDDLGMQDRPILSPGLYRKVVKPYQARMFRYARANCKAHILLHSDGAVAPLIPDFVDMGIDILNPVQVSADGMDTRQLKREFGRDISFWGAGCDSQAVLPFGTPKQVADEAKRRIDDLAPGGGFVFASVHNVQAGVPPANVAAMFKTALEYGVYRR